MKIPVDRLSETPQSFEFDADRDWLAARMGSRPLSVEVAGPLRLSCSAYRIGDEVFIEGSARGEMELECSRCLERYRQELHEGFRLVLEPAGNRVPSDPEGVLALARDGVCLGDELDAGWYQGKQIDLGAIFVEVVSLAPPAQPLCRDDCAGLCQHCGANLSIERCACEKNPADSPFAVLAALRDGRNRGDE